MLKILITRSEKENFIFAENFKNSDGKVLFFNSFYLEKLRVDFNEFQKFTNIIITSKIAADIISKSIFYPVNCYVVGKNAAKILEINTNITLAGTYKNVDALKKDLSYISNKNNLIYYSGNFVTYNFALIHRKIIYNLIYNKTIDKNFLDILAKIDIIVFYSCNAAKNFLELLDEQAFLNLLSHKKIVTLSYKIAQLFTKISDEVFYSNDSCNEQLLAIIKWIIANQSKNQFLPMPPFMLCL